MDFLKKLLKRQKPQIESMHGGPVIQTQEEQDKTRLAMESEMTAQRDRRDEAARAPVAEGLPEKTPD